MVYELGYYVANNVSSASHLGRASSGIGANSISPVCELTYFVLMITLKNSFNTSIPIFQISLHPF